MSMTNESNKIIASSIPANAVAVTPNDSADLAHTASDLFIGTGGDVKVDMEGVGTAIKYKNLPDAFYLVGRITRVYATDTTATNIVARY